MQFTLATLCTEVTKGVVMTTFWKTIIKCYSVIYYLNKRKMIALDYKETMKISGDSLSKQ